MYFAMADRNNNFQSKKCSLRAILRNNDADQTVERIKGAVLMCNQLWTHCLFFVKAFLLFKFEESLRNEPGRERSFPTVNEKFVLNAFRILARVRVGKGDDVAQEQKRQFSAFFEAHYQGTMDQDEPAMSMTHMTQLFTYLSQEVATCYDENIKKNWKRHLQLYVNDAWGKHNRMNAINNGDGSAAEKRQRRTVLHNEFNFIVQDIMNARNDNYVKRSLHVYHAWIDNQVASIMPPGNRNVRNNNVMYDIVVAPQDYLYGMIYMSDARQTIAAARGYNVKLLSVFPLKTSMVPRSIRLDTTAIHQLLDPNRTTLNRREGTPEQIKNGVWSLIANLNQSIFRGNQGEQEDGFKFNHMITTDGIACSILLIRKSQLETRNAGGRRRVEEGGTVSGTPHLTSITHAQRQNLSDKIVVGIDPGLSDLLYCVNEANLETQVQYRHTQNSRRKEANVKINQAQLRMKKETTRVEQRTVSEWEANNNNTNSRTCNFDHFMEYLRFKNALNFKLRPFYNQTSFRRQRLTQYSKGQQINMKLLKEFKSKFHENVEPHDVVVAIGDWEQRIHRYHEPTKGKGIRAVFEKAGYHVYLIDEYRTSKMCSKCSDTNAQCEKFRQVPNPRPYRQGQILCHGLVRCTSCWTMWNRDVNAAVNIWKIAKAILAEQQLPPNHPDLRPDYLRRNANNNA